MAVIVCLRCYYLLLIISPQLQKQPATQASRSVTCSFVLLSDRQTKRKEYARFSLILRSSATQAGTIELIDSALYGRQIGRRYYKR